MKIKATDLISNKPIKIKDGVYIRIPIMEDVLEEENYSKYTRPFTTTIRFLFGTLRNVDEIERKYPTLWEMLVDADADESLGKVLGYDGKASDLFIEAINFWTGLEIKNENGEDNFILLTNGKMIHTPTEWVIGKEEFKELSEIIKIITCYDPEPEDDLTPMRPMQSDSKYESWMKMYKGRVDKIRRRESYSQVENSSLAVKIIILSISSESYIPIDEIKKMSIFIFNKTFDGLQKKEAYEKNWQVQMSPKFDTKGNSQRHWKEAFKI